MSETGTTTETGTESQGDTGTGEQQGTSKPPWGSDEEFDPKRAWTLIEKLGGERESLAKERDTYKGKASEYEQSQMTEQQRLEAERDQFRQERDDATAEKTRLRMAIKYQLDEDDLDLLGSGTDEQIEARAKRLSDRAPKSTPPSKPRERLRGGGDPETDPVETDPAKLAAQVPRNRLY